MRELEASATCSSDGSLSGGKLEWLAGSTERGVREQPVWCHADSVRVPGLVWEPADARACGLVLLGHGASTHKAAPHLRALARRFVRRHQLMALAIDGPIHGDRATGEASQQRFGAYWRSQPEATAFMIRDWRLFLSSLISERASGLRVGYWGLSMGTIFGLPLVAAEPRISVAVLGLMGIRGPTQDWIEAAADRVRCPVLFLQQWDDQLFAREDSLALFDRLASPRKQLHVNVGRHAEVPTFEYDFSREFIARELMD